MNLQELENKLDLLIKMLTPLYEKEKKSTRLKSYKGRMKGTRGDLLHRILDKIKESGHAGVLHSVLIQQLSYHADSTAIKGILKELITEHLIAKRGKLWVSCDVKIRKVSQEDKIAGSSATNILSGDSSLDWMKDVK